MLVTELFVEQTPELYTRFASVIGERHWKHRSSTLRQEIKGNRLLEKHLRTENSVVFQLDHLRELQAKCGVIPLQALANGRIYPAVSFAAQVLSIMENSSVSQAEKLRRRVHGALKNTDDLRALQFELVAATHFIRRGYRVSWPEMNGLGTFDLLVEDAGPAGLEIECKSISEDKGRKIHRREAIEFNSILSSHLNSVKRSLKTGLSAVLTVPGRLPTRYNDRVALARRFATQILEGRSTAFDDGSDIRLTDFDLGKLGHIPSMMDYEKVRTSIDEVTGTSNRETMVIGTRAGGALIITLQSRGNDILMQAVFDTLSDSAKRQLTGTRPAVFLTEFHGLTDAQLLSIAQQDNTPGEDPTALRLAASKFLSSNGRDHVVGIGFLSKSGTTAVRSGVTDAGGSAYYFPKRESPFWNDAFSGMFSWL